MKHPPPTLGWLAILLAVIALTALYADPLRARFLNDDYLFLEEARTRTLAESLTSLGPLGNYYRPLSRQIYFEAVRVVGENPLAFHLVNYGLFLVVLVLLFDLLRALMPVAGTMAGVLYFALLPLQRVNLTWISCSQDLLALLGSLAAVALFRRGRWVPALLAYAAAVASKEAAIPLPALLAAWEVGVVRRTWRAAVPRVAPFAILGLAWGTLALAVRAGHSSPTPLVFEPSRFAAGYVHMIQSLVGFEPGMFDSLLRQLPPLGPLLAVTPLAWWYAAGRPETPSASAIAPGAAALFALAWLVAFGFVIGPVADTWSAYYYTLAAVGGAIVVGLLLRRGDRWTWAAASAFFLWWHTGASEVRSFAVADRPWGWTSHLTSFYFERASALTDTLSRKLVRLEPAPPASARFFFATLPPWAGFQMGNGALVRSLYRDLSIESFFYSQFSDSTAAERPCRFIWWDGADLKALYPNARDLFFQVGSDLLLLDRPAGAAHAFRRGLAAGEERMDHLYWLGWAELWRGRRAAAESVWTVFGALDDSLYWIAHLRAARNALFEDGDTLAARRHLIRAIEFGIGRPEAHAVLGPLMVAERPKYGMLELKVASWLNPRDWIARRDLFLELVRARLDVSAEKEFEGLARVYPEWRADSLVAAARAVLEKRQRRVEVAHL